MTFKTGDAFWVSNFPPLDGGESKRRTAIYVALGDLVPAATAGYHLFVGTTTSEFDPAKDGDAILKSEGLPQSCWILPRWIREIRTDLIGEQVGSLELVEIPPFIEAVLDRYYDFDAKDV